jgi:hypothetical protein
MHKKDLFGLLLPPRETTVGCVPPPAAADGVAAWVDGSCGWDKMGLTMWRRVVEASSGGMDDD